MSAGAALAAGAPSLAEALAAPANVTSPPATADGFSAPIRLSKNENAYGPSDKVIRAAETVAKTFNRYPDVEAEALRHKIAGLHGVTPAQVVLGCGSSEILRMAADRFLGPGKKLVVAVPTFELVERYAMERGADIAAVPLSADYSHDLDTMAERCDQSAGLVYICNPNTPTGSLTRREALEAFLQKLPSTAHVLIDEAYHHYVGDASGYASFIDRPVDDSRVIVTRTFSTLHGLAGLRIGYAIAAADTARNVASSAMSNAVSVVAAAAAAAALDDAEHVRMSVMRNTDDRQEFLNKANARMLKWIDSHTNFIMLNAERPAIDVIEHFKKNNVLVSEPFPHLDTYVRVTLGTPAQMREFWRVWDLAAPSRMRM